MEPNHAENKFDGPSPEKGFTRDLSDLKYIAKKAYDDERCELFQPSQRQIHSARDWLVRVIARLAVDIRKAQETGP